MLVAIADDKADERRTLGFQIEDGGHQVVARTEPLSSLNGLDSWLEDNEAQAFVCDQLLSYGDYAPFQGAEAVSHVSTKLRLPSLLVSEFVDSEELTIRRWRAWIPVVIEKLALSPEKISDGLEQSKAELEGNVPTQRIPRRTGLRVAGVESQGPGVVRAIVPGWDPDSVVRFSLETIQDAGLREDVRTMQVDWLIAKINVDVDERRDLFFEDFERAPDIEGVWERVWRPS